MREVGAAESVITVRGGLLILRWALGLLNKNIEKKIIHEVA